jgi:NitT/TauT family transport system substrate-binding protein
MNMLTRRRILGYGAGIVTGVAAGRWLEALSLPSVWASRLTAAAQLPPPETSTVRIAHLACDAPIMAAERYLQQEGFATIQIVGPATVATGRADMAMYFGPIDIAASLQEGERMVALAGLHPGCAEIWAQPGIRSLRDLRGRTIVVRAKTLSDPYAYLAVVLKHAGLDPTRDVNFVVQPDANPLALYLQGRNDAVYVASAGAGALRANPANRGHIVHDMMMDDPWARLDCCIIVAAQDWYRAHPVAAKRALRAIFRAADFQPPDRADAVQIVTQRGLFGGPGNFDNVRFAANMVPSNWRDLDLERSVRFFGQLLTDVGLLRVSIDEMVRVLDVRILRELRAEMRRP